MLEKIGKGYRYLKRYGKKRFLLRVWEKILGLVQPGPEPPTAPVQTATGRKASELPLAEKLLDVFLATNARLEFPRHEHPVVSFVILLYNRVEMTYQCLVSLIAHTSVPYEVILVDNASTDRTSRLLERTSNAVVLRNPVNDGFVDGCNQGAARACGKHLLFLNNDVELTTDIASVLVQTLEGDPSIGAVGGKLVFPDGRLQEAGSIIWQDGTTSGYGRDDDPDQPKYSYLREVDYCSGALLLTPRERFLSLGGFDPVYRPAYYEEADFCMRLRKNGYRVIYQPLATVTHHEFGSGSKEPAMRLQTINRERFVQRWKDALREHWPRESTDPTIAREPKSRRKNLLFIDDRVPDPNLGCGYPRTYRVLQQLAALGTRVTFFPLLLSDPEPETARVLQQKGIEVMYAAGPLDLEAFFSARRAYYDAVFISRPHNMHTALPIVKKYAPEVPVVYDAEAVFALRDILYEEVVQGRICSAAQKEARIEKEMTLAKAGDLVTAVSDREQSLFIRYGVKRARVVGDLFTAKPTPRPFSQRQDILFVGSVLHSPSPNEDAILYFVREIFPRVQRELSCRLHIAGTVTRRSVWDLNSETIHVTGKVENLTPYYDQCRLFIVPTRYSAGIPLKLLEATAHGLPTVATPLIADQLGWRAGEDLLVGKEPTDFAARVVELYHNETLFLKLRENALARLQAEFSEERFKEDLSSVLREVLQTK